MDRDWNVVKAFLPAAWQDLAAETLATKGLRKDKSAEGLLRTLLIHLACGYSLRETAVRARKARLADMSDVALLKRLKKSSDWLYRLCVLLFNERGGRFGQQDGLQFRLFDATDVKEPGRTGSLWRVHYSVRVPSLVCDFFSVTPTEGTGSGESLRQFPVEPGDCIVADRGYCTPAGIQYATSQGAHVIVRANSQSLPLRSSAGERVDLAARLKSIRETGQVAEWPVMIPGPNGPPVSGRLCVIRKDAEAIRRTRKKLRRIASRKASVTRPETLLAGEYIMVFTNFPETTLSAAEVLEWYRVRWQVELVFKRFKQIARLGHLPKHDAASARAWLYGKLFVSLLSEKLVAYANAVSPWHSDTEEDPAEECLA